MGQFTIDNAISLEDIRKISDFSKQEVLLPVGAVLHNIPSVCISPHETVKIRQGQSIKTLKEDSLNVSVWCEDQLIAIGHIRDNLLHPDRVFNLHSSIS